MRTRFEAPANSGFQDDVVDSMILLHQEAGALKLWGEEVVGVEFITR